MAIEPRLLRRPWAFGTAILGFAIVGFYIAMVLGEGTHSFLELLPWITLMTVPAASALAAAHIKDRRIASNLMIAAAIVFAVLGWVSIFTIGIGFLLAAALGVVSATRLRPEESSR